jgi:F-type H+-transporting ATPase subunit a
MNLLGLVPGCDAPTANLNTTISIALCVFLYYNYVGIRTWKFSYIHHFTGSSKPLIPLMFPIEVISHLARPLSMSLRLFGNIFAEEMTLIIFFGFGTSVYIGVLLGTVPMYFLFLLGKVLQAFILFVLSMIYIQGSVEHAH